MEENSYTLTKEGVIGLLLVVAGSYFFGFQYEYKIMPTPRTMINAFDA